MRKAITIMLMLLAFGATMRLVGSVLDVTVAVQARAPWRSECFNTLDAMVAAMNAAPDRAYHVVTVPSTRNIGGFFGDPYCLIAR